MGAHRRIGLGMQGTNAHCCARAVCCAGGPQYSPSSSHSQLLVDGEGGRVLAIAPRLPSLISRGVVLREAGGEEGLPRGVGLHLRLLCLSWSRGVAGLQLGNMLDASGWSRTAWTWALLLQLLLAGPGGCLSRQELFPFGPGQGDLELEAGDDVVSPALELIGELSFYDRSDITSVYVS